MCPTAQVGAGVRGCGGLQHDGFDWASSPCMLIKERGIPRKGKWGNIGCCAEDLGQGTQRFEYGTQRFGHGSRAAR